MSGNIIIKNFNEQLTVNCPTFPLLPRTGSVLVHLLLHLDVHLGVEVVAAVPGQPHGGLTEGTRLAGERPVPLGLGVLADVLVELFLRRVALPVRSPERAVDVLGPQPPPHGGVLRPGDQLVVVTALVAAAVPAGPLLALHGHRGPDGQDAARVGLHQVRVSQVVIDDHTNLPVHVPHQAAGVVQVVVLRLIHQTDLE